jgi:hypothetical protein
VLTCIQAGALQNSQSPVGAVMGGGDGGQPSMFVPSPSDQYRTPFEIVNARPGEGLPEPLAHFDFKEAYICSITGTAPTQGFWQILEIDLSDCERWGSNPRPRD